LVTGTHPHVSDLDRFGGYLVRLLAGLRVGLIVDLVVVAFPAVVLLEPFVVAFLARRAPDFFDVLVALAADPFAESDELDLVAPFLATALLPTPEEARDGARLDRAGALAIILAAPFSLGVAVGLRRERSGRGMVTASLNAWAAVPLGAAGPAFSARVVNMSRALSPLLRSTPPRFLFRARACCASPVIT
jgi:hypothetical protein